MTKPKPKNDPYQYPTDSHGIKWGIEYLVPFIKESNAIESIYREPTQGEVDELLRFMGLSEVTVREMCAFVKIYQPGAKLRLGLMDNVRIGTYYPPLGGPEIQEQLDHILKAHYSPWQRHIEFEKLHPFMDGNGRAGRALWAWEMKKIDKHLFLQKWYYQTLQNAQ